MASLLTLPVHLVYLILNDLQAKDIFLSAYNICGQLNSIIDSHHSYQVKKKALLQCTISFSSIHLSHQPSEGEGEDDIRIRANRVNHKWMRLIQPMFD